MKVSFWHLMERAYILQVWLINVRFSQELKDEVNFLRIKSKICEEKLIIEHSLNSKIKLQLF